MMAADASAFDITTAMAGFLGMPQCSRQTSSFIQKFEPCRILPAMLCAVPTHFEAYKLVHFPLCVTDFAMYGARVVLHYHTTTQVRPYDQSFELV